MRSEWEALLETYTFQTALGMCGLAFTSHGLAAVVLPSQTEAATERALLRMATGRQLEEGKPTRSQDPPDWVKAAVVSITELLAGGPADLSAIPLDTRKLTPFSVRVHEAARAIPRGECKSYGDLAREVGAPRAARAVGRAMATNPWPIVVPCHRVVSSQGELTGFSAPGGVRTKAAMLEIERGLSPGAQPSKRKRDKPTTQAELPFTPTSE